MSNIPNTLTIFINTRIRGYPKIKYSPNMTVPETKSDVVYFDPLVKLNPSIVKYLPANYPEKEKYTQFFNKNEFYGLIKRTISSTFQKKVDLVQATSDGYIDNDIDIILKTLFAPNSRFYIKGQPFTIYNYEWANGDWRIDTKKFENRLLYSPYGSRLGSLMTQPQYQQLDAEKQLAEFKKEYPAEILNGYSTREKYSNFADTVPVEAKIVGADEDAVKTQKNTFLQHLSKSIPSSVRALVGRDIIEQQSINVDISIRNIPSDPISLSILYAISENYDKDIKMNPTVLEPLYKKLIKAGDDYKEATNNFTRVFGTQLPTINIPEARPMVINSQTRPIPDYDTNSELKDKNVMTQKIKFDNTSQILQNLIDQYKKKGYTIDHILDTPSLKDELSKTIITLTEDRKIFLKLYLLSIQLLLEKIEKMMAYILVLTQFYTNLQKIKQSSSTDSFQLYLIKTTFSFDIQCYQSILEDPTILDNIKNLKIIIKNCTVWINRFLLTPYNYREEVTNFYQYPELILIQKSELDIYLFRVILLDEKNELDVWERISSDSCIFLESIKNRTALSIRNTQQKMNTFRSEYTPEQRAAFKTITAQKGDKLQKQTPLFYESSHTTLIKQMTNSYLQVQNGIITSYDLITLYSRISTIVFAREIAAVTCKKNINNTNLEIFGKSGFQGYYTLIYSDLTIVPILRQPMFWSIPENMQAAIALNNERLEQENQLRLKYNDSITDLQKKYTKSSDLLIPQLSSIGILQQCLKISAPSVPQVVANDFNTLMRSKYDLNGTDEFRRQLVTTYYDGLNDKLLEPISDEKLDEMLEEWKMYGDSYNVGNSLFTSVSIAFNVGLVKENKETNNIYSENGMYSTSSLRNAVADNIGPKDILMWKHLENRSRYSPTDPERIEYNFLFDENNRFIGNNIELVRAAIRLEPSAGGKYYGDYRTVRILENIFKVKMITIHAEIISQDKKYLRSGQIVHFMNGSEEYQGTILGIHSKIEDQQTYDILLEDHTIVTNIDRGQITYIDSNFYTVVCGDEKENLNDANKFTHYVILTEFGSFDSINNYQVAYNTRLKQCVFLAEELPSYIYYLVFKSCWRSKMLAPKGKSILSNDLNWYYKNTVFKNKFAEMTEQINKVIAEKAQQQEILQERELKARKDRVVQRGGVGKRILSVPNKNLYIDVNNMNALQSNDGDSKLSYYIVIDLELYPGEKIPMGERAVLACQSRYEKIRQAYAQLFGMQYQPNEFYRDNFVAPNAYTKKK